MAGEQLRAIYEMSRMNNEYLKQIYDVNKIYKNQLEYLTKTINELKVSQYKLTLLVNSKMGAPDTHQLRRLLKEKLDREPTDQY